MRRSELKRRTPLTSSTGLKPSKLKAVSAKGRAQETTCALDGCDKPLGLNCGKFCSRSCYMTFFALGNGPKSGRTKVCAAEGCENEFYVYPSREIGVQAKKFCSRSCWAVSRPSPSPETRELLRKTNSDRKGEKNPNFRHGRRTGQHERDLLNVFNLKAKGEECCRNCGSGDNLQLHHAIPRSVGTKESRLNLLNGIPLCASCHQSWHRGWLVICRSVFKEDEWEYLSSVQMTGRVTEAWLDKHYPVKPYIPTCKRGHLLIPENIKPNADGQRQCRLCLVERKQAAA